MVRPVNWRWGRRRGFPLISPSLLGGFDILFQLRHSRLDIQIQRFTRETKDAQGEQVCPFNLPWEHAGTVPVVVTTAFGSVTSTVTLAQFGPSFFLLDSKHVQQRQYHAGFCGSVRPRPLPAQPDSPIRSWNR